jgi:catecholate siderophore receptor
MLRYFDLEHRPVAVGMVSAAALLSLCGPTQLAAQPANPDAQPETTNIRPVTVEATQRRPRQTPQTAPVRRGRTAVPLRTPGPQAAPSAPASVWSTNVQSGAAGTTGYVATRITSATKTDTPVLNVPQQTTTLTKDFIQDQSFQAFTEILRYAPGVIPHQGEFNRDQVVIRGQSSSADFYVNGIRDDVQYFRDLYNVYRVDVLKGPNAMIFGRGGAGGVINRILKEADGAPVRELVVQGGQFNDWRSAIDLGGAFNENWAGRINAVYENSDSYRRFVNIERYGINPTATYRTESTKITFSYEYFHDRRVTDRGIPSQACLVLPCPPYNTAPPTFFGNPNINYALVDANIATATIEHNFDSGLQFKNASRIADYDKFYQNTFPGGPVNLAGTQVNLSAYNNETDRTNLFNETDFIYKLETGWVRQTLLAGAEVGRQSGLSFRQDGFFNNAANPNGTPAPFIVSPLNPVTFAPVVFRNIPSGANNKYQLELAAAYLQDQIEITRYLQFIGGLRFDNFDLTSTDRRTNVSFSRVDNLLSPRAGVIVKPIETLSIYGSYSISYLPSSGDQFSILVPGTAIVQPEKIENKEVGIKWEPNPRLLFQAAAYDLDRTNQRLPDPNNPGFFILSGHTNTKGFEAGLAAYVTDLWQVSAGYAYTNAKIVSATSATIVAGNTVGMVPTNVFTVWNRYQFTPIWAAGVGIIHQTSSFASSDDTVRLPGFTRIDLGIFAEVPKYLLPEQVKRLRLQLNIENVFDTHYISMADSNNNITPGSTRAVRGAMVANF